MTTSSQHYDVLVIGGGAAGLMAAGRAAERGKRVLLLEKNKVLGKKLRITGGGRCNITNAEDDTRTLLARYGSAEPFLYSAFSRFGMQDTFSFFEGRGVPLVVEERKRAFPISQSAPDVAEALIAYAAQGGVEVVSNTPVVRIAGERGGIESVVTKTATYTADSYILATGGSSHPETGSTGDGFAFLHDLGHTVVAPTPTIVPLKARDAWIQELQGKTLPAAKISFYVADRRSFSAEGDILLTHFGLSGPTILNVSGRVADLLHEGPVTARIDLFPGKNIGELDRAVQVAFGEHSNKAVKNAVSEFLPAGISAAILGLLPSIDSEKKTHSVTREERRALVDLCKALPVSSITLMGFDRAVVADGGVPPTEVDMRTMRSLQVPNLFITGDLLHITRPSGGYSLQLCWTTGYLAGDSA